MKLLASAPKRNERKGKVCVFKLVLAAFLVLVTVLCGCHSSVRVEAVNYTTGRLSPRYGLRVLLDR